MDFAVYYFGEDSLPEYKYTHRGENSTAEKRSPAAVGIAITLALVLIVPALSGAYLLRMIQTSRTSRGTLGLSADDAVCSCVAVECVFVVQQEARRNRVWPGNGINSGKASSVR